MEAKLGVIGGMGSKATAMFFERVVDRTKANKDQEHINIIILNHATLPDRTHAILTNQGDLFLKEIRSDFDLLERAGVKNIAIPCNTSHFYYEEMQKMTSINIIHMVEETVRKIVETYGTNTKVGILATTGTIQSGVYKEKCDTYNVDLYVPDEKVRNQVMDIIYNIKSDIEVDASELEEIVRHLIVEEKCSCVILACTELSTIKLADNIAKFCIDAMDILVERSIELSGKQMK